MKLSMTYLELWGDEAVYKKHLKSQFPTQLPDVLQQSLHLPLMFLLGIGNLKADGAW